MEMVFRIQPHVRLHEWVAGKRGFLTEEGVDYGLEADGCQTLRALTNSENADDLHALTELVESSAVAPAIDRTYPLSETPAAVQYMTDGHAHGKVVITVREQDD